MEGFQADGITKAPYLRLNESNLAFILSMLALLYTFHNPCLSKFLIFSRMDLLRQLRTCLGLLEKMRLKDIMNNAKTNPRLNHPISHRFPSLKLE
jgi:hypothetical protein